MGTRQTSVTRSADSNLNPNPTIGETIGMATEVYPSHHVSITRPGIRPETRSDVIAILANTANGCLQELGYSPGLLERLRYLEDHVAKGHKTNEKLHHEKKVLKANLEDMQSKCQTYQIENVKLYEDNARLIGENDKLRVDLELLRAQLRVHQETRGMSYSEIVSQHAALQIEHRQAVKQLSTYWQANSNPNNAVTGGQPQPGLVRPPTMVPSQSQVPLRRVSAPSLQPQANAHPHHNQTETQPPQPRPMNMGPVPGALKLTPSQDLALSQSLAQRPFNPQQHQHSQPQPYPPPSLMPPLAMPRTSASTSSPASAPPIGYGAYATLIAAGSPAYRPNSASASVNAIASGSRSASASESRSGSAAGIRAASGGNVNVNVNVNANASGSGSRSAGRGTPTQMQIPRQSTHTPPMSALPLNLQTFPQPHPPPDSRTHAQPHSGPPSRTASAMGSTSSSARIPSVPLVPITVPSMSVEGQQEQRPPDVGDGSVREPELEIMPESTAPLPELEVMQEPAAPPPVPAVPDRSHSPPDTHEAVTPPHGAASEPAVVVAVPGQQPLQDSPSLKRASPNADDEDGEEARKRARVAEPVKMEMDTVEAKVKTEVDDSLGAGPVGSSRQGGEEEDEEDEGFIELDADGFRTVSDCVDAVFDPDDGFVCQFCQARYDQDAAEGVASAAPQSMASASIEDLAKHCEVEHAYAWNLLRTNVNPAS
ncbi:hypothetical protein B0H16DRAFT_602815 [Mycena metata]|uniref:Uncharacterized protein n=1 Tax=Mycena metata TaxID=1033252 RepID=A0AAD7KB57_9AGAR|nr:hypothetical protein B0H16DRAFT_602815 [Mycena metata]